MGPKSLALAALGQPYKKVWELSGLPLKTWVMKDTKTPDQIVDFSVSFYNQFRAADSVSHQLNFTRGHNKKMCWSAPPTGFSKSVLMGYHS
ncbi:unnamed protein product, partial [Ilex paraguariensis]